MFGKKHSKETLDKIKKNRNKVVNQEELNELSRKRNSKSVLQFNLDGVFIKEYESIKLCSLETGISESLIGKSCRGLIKNPGKFRFLFKDKESKILNNSFRYKVGDFVLIDDKTYFLIKRNRTTCIVSLDDELFNFRKKDYHFLWNKITL